ncbi:MAG: ferritin family protein [bacterium]
MDTKERLNALQVALNTEMRERAFYLNHAARTTNPVGQAMFRQIADEELEHYQRLQELHKKWEKQEKWPETVPLQVKGTVVKDVIAEAARSLKQQRQADADDLEAIRTAIRFEEEGARNYAKLRDAVADPRERQFFSLMAQIENEHFLSLKDAEELLTDPESWYRKKEHHVLDGG